MKAIDKLEREFKREWISLSDFEREVFEKFAKPEGCSGLESFLSYRRACLAGICKV